MHDFEEINQYRDIYLSLLKKHSTYSVKPSCWKKEMGVYSESIDSEFREYFPAERFMAGKNDFEKIKKILRWVNEALMFPQQQECPYPLTAKRILVHVRENKVTVNCLSHAIVLNECLHQLGIVSRIIFCLPIDMKPLENHVVVHAYSEQYSKWVMLDPSWNCYYCDQSGKIMSLPEIRRAIAADLPFSIQYNHRITAGAKESSFKQYFIWENLYSYLCKNLFRFSYLGEYNAERTVQYELLPPTILDKELEIVEKKAGHIDIHRFVTNDEEFWQAPSVILECSDKLEVKE